MLSFYRENNPQDKVELLDEMLGEIAKFLPPNDVMSLSLVSRKMRSLALDDAVWKNRIKSSYSPQSFAGESFKKYFAREASRLGHWYGKNKQPHYQQIALAYFNQAEQLLNDLFLRYKEGWLYRELGCILLRVNPTEERVKTGLDYLHKAAELDDTGAMFFLALVYRSREDFSSGLGRFDISYFNDYDYLINAPVQKNKEVAIQWADKALEKNNPDAKICLVWDKINYFPRTVNRTVPANQAEIKRNVSESFAILREMLSRNVEANYIYGMMSIHLARESLAENEIGEEVFNKRFRYGCDRLVRAAENGHLISACIIVDLYFGGLVLPERLKAMYNDDVKAIEYLTLAAANGQNGFAVRLGNAYLHGGNFDYKYKRLNIEKNLDKAIALFSYGARYVGAATDSIGVDMCLHQLLVIYEIHKPDAKKWQEYAGMALAAREVKCLKYLGVTYASDNHVLKLKKDEKLSDEYFDKMIRLYGKHYWEIRADLCHEIACQFKMKWKNSGRLNDDLLQNALKWSLRGWMLTESNICGYLIESLAAKRKNLRDDNLCHEVAGIFERFPERMLNNSASRLKFAKAMYHAFGLDYQEDKYLRDDEKAQLFKSGQSVEETEMKLMTKKQ